MRLKQFQCFVSFLFQSVQRSEIKSEIKIGLFQFYFTMCDGLYADDLVLLTPTPFAMCKLLDVYDEYAQEFSMKFNVTNGWLLFLENHAGGIIYM